MIKMAKKRIDVGKNILDLVGNTPMVRINK